MLVTENFVFLNMPKTGSTFVRKNLRRIHEKTYKSHGSPDYPRIVEFAKNLFKSGELTEYYLPSILDYGKPAYMTKNQHGLRADIPEQHTNKHIVSVYRNVFDRYYSQYTYEHWKRFPVHPLEEIRSSFPNFPDLSFEEFVDYWTEFNPSKKHPTVTGIETGPLSSQFIFFYSTTPEKFVGTESEENIAFIREDVSDVELLDFSNLNASLHSFLQRMGYEAAVIDHIVDEPPLNVSRSTSVELSEIFTDSVIEKISKLESTLLKVLPPERNKPDFWLPKTQD